MLEEKVCSHVVQVIIIFKQPDFIESLILMGKITILYENHPNPSHPELINAHGFAALIEFKKFRILFDTGWDGEILLSNAHNLGIELEGIDAIFISHGHWDHMGGLPSALKNFQPQYIYLPSDYSRRQPKEFKRYSSRTEYFFIGESRTLSEFTPELASTGTWKKTGPIGEHALILPSSNSLESYKENIMVVGCLHPGLKTFMDAAANFGSTRALIGGLHGFKDIKYLTSGTLKDIYGGHCTMHSDLMQNLSKPAFHPLYVGYSFEFN